MKLKPKQIACIKPYLEQHAQLQRNAVQVKTQLHAIIESWDPPEEWILNQDTWTLEVAANVSPPETDG